MKQLFVKGILAICVLILATISDAASADKARPKVRIGIIPTIGASLPYSGYIGAWKDEGLDVDIKEFQGGPAGVEAIMAGEIDVTTAGYVPMILAATKGLPLYYLASDGIATSEYPQILITVRPDLNIKSFKDLKGKTIAIHMRGTPQELLYRLALEKYGMRESDLKIVLVPWAQQGGVLAHKQVDAGILVPPFDALQEFNKQGKVVWDTSDVMAYTPISGLVVSRKFANQYPEATQKMLKAYIKGSRWVDDNQSLAREKAVTAKEYFYSSALKPEVANLTRFAYWPRNGFHLMPAVWSTYYLMVKMNMIKAWNEPEAEAKMKEYFIDPTMKYTVPAVRELGVSQDPYIYKILRTPLPYLAKKPENYFAPWEKEDAGLIITRIGSAKPQK